MSVQESLWRLSDLALGPCVRRISATSRVIYLTFDDGPDRMGTAPLLDLLESLHVPATFFLVATRAQANKELVNSILRRGHSVGNHSLDHGYKSFFQGRRRLKEWIYEAEERLSFQIGKPTVGFRPPAGVRTPELNTALRELNMPLVLWDQRYFDTARQLPVRRMIEASRRMCDGSIILLHDRKSEHALPGFIAALTQYIEFTRAQGITFGKLTREATLQEVPHAQAVP